MMAECEPLKYIEKIVLEILDRPSFCCHQWRAEKFNIEKFNAKEAAHAFLTEYNGIAVLTAQKIVIPYNNQDVHLCVRNIVHGKISRNSKKISNTTVEFVYRNILFGEIKWPAATVNRVRWAHDENELPILNTPIKPSEVYINDDYSSINIDTRTVPRMLCSNRDNDQSLSVNSAEENFSSSSCENRGIHHSVPDASLTLGHVTDGENHFRSSIYVHVNQVHNSE